MLRPENGLFVADFVAMLGLKNVEKRTGLEQKCHPKAKAE